MLVVRDAGAKLIDIPGLLLHLLEYTMEEEFETDLWEFKSGWLKSGEFAERFETLPLSLCR